MIPASHRRQDLSLWYDSWIQFHCLSLTTQITSSHCYSHSVFQVNWCHLCLHKQCKLKHMKDMS